MQIHHRRARNNSIKHKAKGKQFTQKKEGKSSKTGRSKLKNVSPNLISSQRQQQGRQFTKANIQFFNPHNLTFAQQTFSLGRFFLIKSRKGSFAFISENVK